MMKRLLLILLLAAPLGAQNDFSGDPNCVALYRFENGALTTDSIGSNTLTATGSPSADTGDYQEGAASVDCERDDTEYFTCLDTNLDSGFPLRSANSYKNCSLCCWIKPESSSAVYYYPIWGKGFNATNEQTVAFLYGTPPKVYFWVATAGGGVNTSTSTNSLTLNQWYHIGFVIDDGNSFSMRIWDDNAGTLLEQKTTETDPDALCDANRFAIGVASSYAGSFSRYDGWFDEVVVFNDVLTADEIDEIRGGTYTSSSTVNDWWWRRRHND